ncbi:glycosyltransferase [Vibrio astriarenae]|uniref:Glycosyltransferase n=1 Tax=Vibrio astriarenae TaxID=1481923 RepID=A0A7Z2YEU1_9VIBR|nr:glycosyltransferase family 2 protein [Vibrio astriarenae]QIA64460.1 glycosyltransferase [Vibrio astriarenae]
MKSSNIKVAAVVVFYHPNLQAINSLKKLSKMLPVVVVDNTEEGEPLEWVESESVNIIRNMCNLGVAKAINQGVEYWQSQGMNWCFLFDQDSVIDDGFIEEMITPITSKRAPADNVAAYVPSYYAKNLESYGSIIQVEKFGITRRHPKYARRNELWASYAINSGSLINLNSFNTIGPYLEGLFIDFCDIEWGLRANAKGFQIITNPEATLIQELGEQPISFMGKKIVNHSPLRHYYYIRNAIHMLRLKHVPLVWKTVECAKMPVRFALYSTMTSNRIQHLKAMTLGLIHGLKNKQGKYCESTRNR